MALKSIKQNLHFSDGKIEQMSDLLNFILEYFMFYRWIYFKNRPRGNLLFLRSLLVVGTFAFLFFKFFHDFRLVLMGIDINPVIAMGAATALGYWNMVSVFHNKSSTCTTIYTEIMKAKGEGNLKSVELLSNSFALNLLTMDMWAHRLYDSFFSKNLEIAIHHHFYKGDWSKAHPQASLEEKNKAINDYIEIVNAGRLQAREARYILTEYREFLWNQ